MVLLTNNSHVVDNSLHLTFAIIIVIINSIIIRHPPLPLHALPYLKEREGEDEKERKQ